MNRKLSIDIKEAIPHTNVLHRCKCCGHLQNIRMIHSSVLDKQECSHCGMENYLEVVQSYIPNHYDVLCEYKHHPILMINVNGEKLRFKGRFVKVIDKLDRRETFNLHLSLAKQRNPVEVVNCA